MLSFLLIIGAFSFIFLILKHIKNNQQFHPPPSPKGLPLIGNLHQFDPLKPHVYFAKLANIYGPILRLQLGRRTLVVIQSAELAKEVLQTQEKNFCNRMLSVAGQRLSYNGLDVVFAPYNEYYKEVRKLFAIHLLSSKRVQSLAPIRYEEISRLIQKISSMSSASKVINMSELLVNFATSSICRMAFGKRYDDDDVSRSRFQGLSIEAQALHASLFFSDLFPYFGWLLDKLTGNYSRLEKTFKECDKFYEEIINDHLTSKKPKSKREDIIDILLHLKKEGSLPFELTMNHMKAMLMDIILAGTDTSAATEIWVMTELIRNPNVMEKVQKEIRNAIGNKGYIEEDDLSNFEYLKAVVKETFRLHPPTPLLMPRETSQRCTIEGYDILPKTMVSINLWAIGRDPDIWDEPNLFKPERFLGSSITFQGKNFELIPFGAGRRICPGMHLGWTSVELVIANLLYSFDWELPCGLTKEDIDTDVHLGVVMHKKNPLYLVANNLS